MERSKGIIKVSLVGILANVILAGFKAAVGALSGSVAVILDAVNNLSDALSSVVTIVGARLSRKPPDQKHPFGYGRLENISAVTVAVIVLIAGVTAFKESVEKIITPTAAEYSVVGVIVIAAAVPVKFFLGRYFKAQGKKLRSEALSASGADASFDAIISLSTLVAALVSMIWHVTLEGWLGAAIAVVIVKAGAEILLESLSGLIGARAEGELTRAVREKVNSYDAVRGSYDLILNRYGEARTIGSVHIEVDDSMTARELHALSRQIAADIYREFGIILTVGIYASNTGDETSAALRSAVEAAVAKRTSIRQMHGFYVDAAQKRVSFDVVPDFGTDPEALIVGLRDELSAAYPDYQFDIVLDSDFSD